MFCVQTSQLESRTWLRIPRRSWERLRKTPLLWMTFWAVCRSSPTRAGMAKSTTGAVAVAGAGDGTGAGVSVTVTVTGAGVGATATGLGADEEVDAVALADASPVSPPALPMTTPATNAAATPHTAGRLWTGFLAGADGSGAVGNRLEASYGGWDMGVLRGRGGRSGRAAETGGPAPGGSGWPGPPSARDPGVVTLRREIRPGSGP